jgi:hypothetical protein
LIALMLAMASETRNPVMKRLATTLTLFGVVLGLSACANMPNNGLASSVSPTANMVAGPGAGVTNTAANPNMPGATGRVIVPGDNSTIAGDADATLMQRTGRV